VQAFDYSNFHTWVDREYTFLIEALDPGEITENYSYTYLPVIFEGYTEPTCTTWEGWFIMNMGDYNITDVCIYTDSWNTTSGAENVGFEVRFYETHTVFVAAVLCDDIAPSFAENLFSDLETNDNFIILNGTKVNGYWYGTWENTTFSDRFSIDFVVFPFQSSYNTSLIRTEMWNNDTSDFLKNETGNKLGLSSDWEDTHRISIKNHGFDIALCITNTTDLNGSCYSSTSYIFINYQGGSSWNSCALLHEIGHIYMYNDVDTEHLRYNPVGEWYGDWYINDTYRCGNYSGSPYGGNGTGYIMSMLTEGIPTWFLHPDNEIRIAAYTDLFDGPPE
jgi:hypothetical protein